MLVHSAVICTLIRRGRFLAMGRGRWGFGWATSAFSCALDDYSSWTSSAYGASRVVAGKLDGA